MGAIIILNLVPAMAKFQKTGKQSTSPQTKYRNKERLFTEHVNQEVFAYPQTGTTSGKHGHSSSPIPKTPCSHHQVSGNVFPAPPPSEVSNSEKPSHAVLWRWLHTAKVISFSKIQRLQKGFRTTSALPNLCCGS